MSNSNSDDWWIEVLFWIFGVCAAIAAAFWLGYWILFGVFWIVPYGIFTLVPLAVLSAGVAYGLKAFCMADFDEAQKEVERDYYYAVEASALDRAGGWAKERKKYLAEKKLIPKKFHGHRLGFLFPVLVAVCFGVFSIPQPHETYVEKVIVQPEKKIPYYDDADRSWDGNGNEIPHYRTKPAVTRDETRTAQQWPWLVTAFNRFNGNYQSLFPDSFLKQGKPYEEVLFDRNVFSVVAWIALLIIGPFLFFVLADEPLEHDERSQVSSLKTAVEQERATWQDKQDVWKKEKASLEQIIERAENLLKAKQQEIQVLTAKLSFTPQGQQAKVVEMSEKPGVLDSDLL